MKLLMVMLLSRTKMSMTAEKAIVRYLAPFPPTIIDVTMIRTSERKR